ncbi:AMP-binding protein [Marinicrinis sediminis]|uniref:AMP-binding protein n=1 Tax=Marinicrinis sediminis TaxID=1652465 RepID=A0ABW5RE70_9BACL
MIDRTLLSLDAFQQSRDHWQNRIHGNETKTSLPATYPQHTSYRLQTAQFTLPVETATELRRVSRGKDISTYVFMLAAYYVLLYKFTDHEEITVTLPVLPAKEMEYDHQYVVIPQVIQPRAGFREWLKHFQQQLKEDWKHQHYPLSEVAYALGWDSEQALLGSTCFGMSSLHGEEKMASIQTSCRFDTVINLVQREEDIDIQIVYNGARYDAEAIAMYTDSYAFLLKQMLEDSVSRMEELSIHPRDSLLQWLEEMNETEAAYQRSGLIHQRFEAHAALHPDDIAIRHDEGVLTYEECNQKANQWAHLLRQHGLQNGEDVAVMLDRSPDMIVAVLAILKAGGAYVPIEPSFPKTRIETIWQELNIAYLFTKSGLDQSIQELYYSCETFRHVFFMDVQTASLPSEPLNAKAIEQMWDHVAEDAIDRVTAGGFQNSYTGEAFTEMEVAQYRDRMLELMQPHLHAESRVLEVGCGSGLITFSLAKQVQQVTAMDPSGLTLRRNQIEARESGIHNVNWQQGFAHDCMKMGEGNYDLILLASTVQFFPGIRYLEQTVRQLMQLLKPGGVLVLGDLLDLQKKQAFADSLQAYYRANPKVEHMKRDLDGELYIHAQLLQDLTARNQQIAGVDICRRDPSFSNELQYRFDAVLHKASVVDSPSDKKSGAGGHGHQRMQHTAFEAAMMPTESVQVEIESDQKAYTIFTSGSTGKPKGVVVQHRPVINLIEWAEKKFQFQSDDCVLFITSLCFDLSVFDVFGMLSYGGSIRIVREDDIRHPDRLMHIICSEPVTFWDSAPAALHQLVPYMENGSFATDHSRLRLVFLSGDWIPLTLPPALQQAFSSVQVVALGGATEATVWSNYFLVDEIDPSWVSIPYGKPIQNARYYILNSRGEPCPAHVPGELFIGGECLAAGYTSEAITAERFVPDPFAGTVPNGQAAVMYKTGDLARWRSDGQIEFLGRVDHQVKIRGYRIELGEIQAQLMQYEGIKWVMIMDRVDAAGDKYLAAYYLAARGKIAEADLREHAKRVLPAYMVPSYYVQLESVPITPNGKVDRKALPDPQQRSASAWTPPKSEPEEKLAALLGDILGIERIGREDDFFELGGDSLKLVRLVSRANEKQLNLSFRDLLEYPSIAKLSEHLGWEQTAPRKGRFAPFQVPARRNHNEEFKEIEELPYYYPCFMGAMRQKLTYETGISMHYGYLPAIEGYGLLGYAHPKGSESSRLHFVNYPYGSLVGFKTLQDQFQIDMQFNQHESLADGMDFVREQLKQNRVPAVCGTTYFLKFSSDYYKDEDEWIAEMERGLEIRRMSGTGMENSAHLFLVVDELEDEMLIYDSTFNYFGTIDKEDFKKSFTGLKAIDFMQGHPAVEFNPSYMSIDFRMEAQEGIRGDQLGLELFEHYMQSYVENRELRVQLADKDSQVYIGVEAIKEFRKTLAIFLGDKQEEERLKNHIHSVVNDWKYKFHFLSDFLKQLHEDYPALYVQQARKQAEAGADLMTEIRDQIDAAGCSAVQEQGANWLAELEQFYEALKSSYAHILVHIQEMKKNHGSSV